jgi:GNAT superfamily N-acetyltransferase
MMAWKTSMLSAREAEGFEEMTFPVYRHLLALSPAPRHPEQGDVSRIQPIAVGILGGDEPVGLVLAELPLEGDGPPQLLSIFVAPELRNQGLGCELVQAMEEAVRERGFDRLQAVYMAGKSSTPALERVLEKRGFPAPSVRTITVRFTPEEAASTPWFAKVRLPPADYEVFSWTELKPEERETLMRTQRDRPWIASGLEPWRHDRHGFDEVSSVGLRYRGDVVGWVINHRVNRNMVRFTCSFMRKDLGRRGRILPLFTESVRRLLGTECTTCSLITPISYGTMIQFLQRRCAAWVSLFTETRETTKELLPREDRRVRS